jgi:hypothetical protein
MSINSLNEDIKKQRGRPSGYPKAMSYSVMEDTYGITVSIELIEETVTSVRSVDPWGFAVFSYTTEKLQTKPNRLQFILPSPKADKKPQYEALKRRLSYLALANEKITISFIVGSQQDKLYTRKELFNRPENENVRTNFEKRDDADKPGRLEKDFQTYLYGKGLYDNTPDKKRTNERLALLGNDFIKIKAKVYCLEREFPTGVFNGEIKEQNRILPTEYIDFVTLNKNGDIAVIELKFDNDRLEDIAQILDYAIFFHTYKNQLVKSLNEHIHHDCADTKIAAYLVSNKFHNKFTEVWKYYKCGEIRMNQVIMGYMPDGDKK